VYLNPIIRISFEGNQFYFRTIRKLKIEELPAYEFGIRMRHSSE